MFGGYLLLASEIILRALGLIVEITSVLNGDGIPLLRLVRAVALGDDLPSDTHYASGIALRLLRRMRESKDEIWE